jgi:hypothetical protein
MTLLEQFTLAHLTRVRLMSGNLQHGITDFTRFDAFPTSAYHFLRLRMEIYLTVIRPRTVSLLLLLDTVPELAQHARLLVQAQKNADLLVLLAIDRIALHDKYNATL